MMSGQEVEREGGASSLPYMAMHTFHVKDEVDLQQAKVRLSIKGGCHADNRGIQVLGGLFQCCMMFYCKQSNAESGLLRILSLQSAPASRGIDCSRCLQCEFMQAV